MTDLLLGARWELLGTDPGAAAHPDELPAAGWRPAVVPGTVAAATGWHRDGSRDPGAPDASELDGRDWWYRCCVAAEGDLWLVADGLATLSTIWCDGDEVAACRSMWQPLRAGVRADGVLRLHVRLAALGPVLAGRHPRPRWKTPLAEPQSLRWHRTSLLGRGTHPPLAPVVGPWRPVHLLPVSEVPVLSSSGTATRLEGHDGVVDVDVLLGGPTKDVRARIGGASVDLDLAPGQGVTRATGHVDVGRPARWWPHTHGEPALHDLELVVDGVARPLRRVGFRTVEADRADGGFALKVNGTAVFARGAVWVPADPAGWAAGRAAADHLAELARAGCNLVRVPGTAAYEDEAWWGACDELGLLVWQDLMWAAMDPPDDAGWRAGFLEEASALGASVAAHPSLAVLSGGSETEQRPAMLGMPPATWRLPLFDVEVPAVLAATAPGTPYVPSSPTGGTFPFTPSTGVAHYFGVGAYRRPIEDAATSGVRFAAECLALATPPDRLPDGEGAWKVGVPRDAGAAWDFEDVVAAYTADLLGPPPRWEDQPERRADLARATAATLVTGAFAWWRRAGSPCAGALVLAGRDQVAGSGWGLLDVDGAPKAPLWALGPLLAPVACWFVDRGLGGVELHLANDTAEPCAGRLEVVTHREDGSVVERGERHVVLAPAAVAAVEAEGVLGGWRDLGCAYGFGGGVVDCVAARLTDEAGDVLAEAVHLPGGQQRPLVDDLGLAAEAHEVAGGWELAVSTGRLAQWVAIDAPGWRPTASWFHLAPGSSRRVGLLAGPSSPPAPRGAARALNGARAAAFGGRPA